MIGIRQVIYVDVLFCLNMLLGFFIVKSAELLCRKKSSTVRVLAASVLSGAYSLVIFLPECGAAVSVLMRLGFLLTETAVVFGFIPLKAYIRGFAGLTGISLFMAGLVLGVWLVFRPSGLIIRNSSVYLDISFVTLVLFAAGVYTAVRLAVKLRKTESEKSYCTACVKYAGTSYTFGAVIDTGNTLTDSFTGKKICVIDRTAALAVIGSAALEKICRGELPEGMHYTLASTVSGDGLLPVFNVQGLEVKTEYACYTVEGISFAVAASDSFENKVSVLINAECLPLEEYGKGETANDKKNTRRPEGFVHFRQKEKCFLHKRRSDPAAAADPCAGKRDNAAHRAGRQ